MSNLGFEEDLQSLLNYYSIENESDTPDFILARYLLDCLDAFNRATNTRGSWYGRKKENFVTLTNKEEINNV